MMKIIELIHLCEFLASIHGMQFGQHWHSTLTKKILEFAAESR
jgi:hypothetical protein